MEERILRRDRQRGTRGTLLRSLCKSPMHTPRSRAPPARSLCRTALGPARRCTRHSAPGREARNASAPPLPPLRRPHSSPPPLGSGSRPSSGTPPDKGGSSGAFQMQRAAREPRRPCPTTARPLDPSGRGTRRIASSSTPPKSATSQQGTVPSPRSSACRPRSPRPAHPQDRG